MTIYFAGGEDIDFTLVGEIGIETGNGFRSTHARHALYALPGSTDPRAGGALGALSGAVSDLWVGLRFAYLGSLGDTGGRPLMSLWDGATARLDVGLTDSGELTISTVDGTPSVVALSTVGLPVGALSKLDLQVTYGANGRAYLYLDGTLMLTFSGDLTRGGSTTLSAISLHSPSAGASRFAFSEVIVADRDTRPLALKTLVPTAIANAGTWAGTIADVTDLRANGTTALATASGDDTAILSVGAALANATVTAVRVQARAARGVDAPTSIQIGAGSASNIGYAAKRAVPTSWVNLGATFDRNPATNAAWTLAQIGALAIGISSRDAQATRIVTQDGFMIVSEKGDTIVAEKN